MRALWIALCLGAVLAAPAHAARPGPNGPIAYVSSRAGPPIPSVVDPGRDGKPRAIGQMGEVAPAWSTDGAAIAITGKITRLGIVVYAAAGMMPISAVPSCKARAQPEGIV